MSERTIEQVRSEIEAERRLLVDDVAVLREDMKKVLPLAIGQAGRTGWSDRLVGLDPCPRVSGTPQRPACLAR